MRTPTNTLRSVLQQPCLVLHGVLLQPPLATPVPATPLHDAKASILLLPLDQELTVHPHVLLELQQAHTHSTHGT